MAKWFKQIATAACAAFTAICTAQSAETANAASATLPNNRPNVVIILADDLGYADIGVQGISADVRTPNIDSIATSGVRFTNGYVSCPVCSPTRAGLLTGRYQQRFGHEFNSGGNDPKAFGLPLDQITLADVMKKAGYATGMTGKWHEGNQPGYWPNDRGFDEFYGFLGGAHKYLDNDVTAGVNALMRNRQIVGEPDYLTDAISREAAAFIDHHHESSFFLYVPYNAVHTPQQAPQKYQDRFKDVKDQRRRLLLAMLSAEDDGVGLILSKLREYGIEDNTLVFFLSDNGAPTPGNGSRNTPLSGYKGQVWEGGIRIPFMAQWKNHLPAGKVFDQPVISLDIFATTAAVTGATVPTDRVMDGVDLMPLMTGKTDQRPHQTLYWRFTPQWAVRDGDYKLVHFGDAGDKLFDLSKDVEEKHDLSEDKPEIAEQLRIKFEAWDKQLMAPRWKSKAKFQEDVEEYANQESGKAARKGKRKVRHQDDDE